MRPGLAACGVMAVDRRLPSPGNPSDRLSYVSSMSTDVDARHRGLARAVLGRIIAEAMARGIERIGLHATDDGPTLYLSEGFVPTRSPELRLSKPGSAAGVSLRFMPSWSATPARS